MVKKAIVERSREVSYIDFDESLRDLQSALGIWERWDFVRDEEEREGEESEESTSEKESWV